MKQSVKLGTQRLLLARAICLAVVATGYLEFPIQARCESGPFSENEPRDRWVPGLAVSMGAIVQGADATVSSTVRPPAAGDDMLTAPLVGAQLELMTPSLNLPGRPRAFAQLGILLNWGYDRDVAKEGDPGKFDIPTGDRVGENEITGAGSQLRIKWNREIFTAGIGVAFELDVFERLVLVKPSVEWVHYTLRLQGRVHRVFKPDPFDPAARFVTISGTEDMDNDAIGPGLEVEIDAGRAGPVAISAFIGAQVYRLLKNDDEGLTARFTDATGTETGRFDAEIDPWLVRGGVGVRVKWLPL